MVRALRLVGVVAIFTLAVLASTSCGDGNGITSPSDLQKNLNSAPPGAFEISDGTITVRFWFDISPGAGAVIGPGDTVTVKDNCRASSGTSYMLEMTVKSLQPDGTLVDGFFGSNNWGKSTTVCAPGNMGTTTVTLGANTLFRGIKELRISTSLRPDAPGSKPTATATFVQPVGWIPK